MDKKQLKKLWTAFLIDNGLKNVDVAEKLGITGSALGQRINNGSIRFIDIVNIFESYGYVVGIHKKQE